VGGKVGGKVGYTWHTEKTFGAVRYGKVKSKQSNTYIYGKRKPLPGCIDIFTKVRPAYTYI